MSFCVYKHTTPSNKVYIGITSKSPKERWVNGYGYHHNKHFTSAIEKYGWENIKHEVLYENLTKEEAEAKEIQLISEYHSNDRRYGYNVQRGGSVSRLGLKHSDETKRKISLKGKGRKISEEQKLKQSERLKGKEPVWCRGLCHTKEADEKRRRTLERTGVLKGRNLGSKSPRAKGVSMYTTDGQFIKSFGAFTDAQRETGVDYGSIVKVCRGQRKSAGGYFWQYGDYSRRQV